MKKKTLLTVLFSLSILSLAYAQEELSPLYADIYLEDDERLIEPTSPILGKNLVAHIRYDKRHPKDVVSDLLEKNPNLLKELQLSSIAYFKTLINPLNEYCASEQKEEANDKRIGVVEMAAIPLVVLDPLHGDYIKNVSEMRNNYVEKTDIPNMANIVATKYQKSRYDCNVVKKLNEIENKAKKYLPKRLDRLVDLHNKISSPEAAYPRIQFSINGFTQYVYDELYKLDTTKLSNLLKTIYDAQVEWLDLREKNPIQTRFISHFENKAIAQGFLPRDILLVLAYSTRNMSSLDVQYGYDSHKALILEAYFWKFREIRDVMSEKYFPDIFPDVNMRQNPGIYHYATASLLACEVRLNGFTGAMARIVALGNKIGYKVHKLIGEISGQEGKKSLKKISQTAKKQGFGPGVDAGKHGGKHGLRFCRKFTPKNLWPSKNKISKENLTNSILDDEDLSDEYEDLI